MLCMCFHMRVLVMVSEQNMSTSQKTLHYGVLITLFLVCSVFLENNLIDCRRHTFFGGGGIILMVSMTIWKGTNVMQKYPETPMHPGRGAGTPFTPTCGHPCVQDSWRAKKLFALGSVSVDVIYTGGLWRLWYTNASFLSIDCLPSPLLLFFYFTFI